MLAYLLLAAVVLHLLGLVLHTIRHRENIAWSMVDGRKIAPVADALPRHGALGGTVVAALVALIAVGIFRGYDAATGRVRVPAIGLTLTLKTEAGGRSSGEQHRGDREQREERDDHD